MDLDKLLAALQHAADAVAPDAPLVTCALYVPPASAHDGPDLDAARRMLAAFVHWLLAHDRLARDAAAARSASMRSLQGTANGSEQVMHALGDALFAQDVEPAFQTFARAYLAPGPGHLGDDYFKLFVEARGGRSLRDARPDAADLAQLSAIIESRARSFQGLLRDWDSPLVRSDIPVPALWQGGSREAWLHRLACYHDLTDSPPAIMRTRLDEYWSLIDAAPAIADGEVATALVGTFLWIDDSSIQQSVARALRQFPPELALQGMLAHIVALEKDTDWACELVDVFPDELDASILATMAARISNAPQQQRSACERALQHAETGGSRHAARLLHALRLRVR